MQQDLPVEHHAIGGVERGDSSLHGTLDGGASRGRFRDNGVEVTIDGAARAAASPIAVQDIHADWKPDGWKVG